MSPSLLYHKPLRNCNTFLPVICKSKKKTNLLCLLTTSFNIARFEHENEVRRKALKPGKKMESRSFWNPESTVLESGIRNPVPGIRNPQHGIQNPRLSWIPLHGAKISHYTQLLCQVSAKSVDHNFWPLEHFLRQ